MSSAVQHLDWSSNASTMHRGAERLLNCTSINETCELSTNLPIEHPVTWSRALFAWSAHPLERPPPYPYSRGNFCYLLWVATKVVVLAYTSRPSPTPEVCNLTTSTNTCINLTWVKLAQNKLTQGQHDPCFSNTWWKFTFTKASWFLVGARPKPTRNPHLLGSPWFDLTCIKPKT